MKSSIGQKNGGQKYNVHLSHVFVCYFFVEIRSANAAIEEDRASVFVQISILHQRSFCWRQTVGLGEITEIHEVFPSATPVTDNVIAWSLCSRWGHFCAG